MAQTIIRTGALDMQVCVLANWPDREVLQFANTENPCGTPDGWSIRRGGGERLADHLERVTCTQWSNHVHIMLDA